MKALVVVCALAATVHAEPTDRTVFYTGLALAPPDYLLGVTLHEGSHALMGKLVGANIVKFHVFPPGRDPKGFIRFGWTYVTNLKGNTNKMLFYIAPKITDALLLGGFAALVFTGAWPDNRYGQVALTVFATGLWVDFSKDLVVFKKSDDVVKVFDLWCIRGWRHIPARLAYAGLVVGFGAIVAKGFKRTFDDDTSTAARTFPLLVRAF